MFNKYRLRASNSVSAPDINSFTTFSADKHTYVGKMIQNLIGSTKEHTIEFSSSRRIRGTFYFYNYGVYAEIGVTGWTDKKNWIGWSKTESDELRVGWTRVVLKQTLPNNYSQMMKTLNDPLYLPPQYMYVNGQLINVATLVVPSFTPTFKDKFFAYGGKAVFDYLKDDKFKRPQSELEKAEAYIIASQSEVYYVFDSKPVVKYNTKSYTHVFSQSWGSFEFGYNSQSGVFLNGINQNNYNNINSWLSAIDQVMKSSRPTLVSGEVYICGRFSSNWRGIKIVKKEVK